MLINQYYIYCILYEGKGATEQLHRNRTFLDHADVARKPARRLDYTRFLSHLWTKSEIHSDTQMQIGSGMIDFST